MRTIPYDIDVANVTFAMFGNMQEQFARGFVGENLIKTYYNQPLTQNTGPDEGWDFIWQDAKVDIKCHHNDYRWFGSFTTRWRVNCDKGLRADVYLFAELDTENCQIVLTGWMTREEVQSRGKFYNKGAYIEHLHAYNNKFECYLVGITDMHPIGDVF